MERLTERQARELAPLARVDPEVVSPLGDKPIISERQARELTPLAYAERIGKDAENVRKYQNGAEVYESVENSGIDTDVLLDKAQHLAATWQYMRVAESTNSVVDYGFSPAS